jgi:NIPSNAP protein
MCAANPVYTIGMIRKVLPLLFFMAAFAFGQSHVYELRTYTTYEGKLDALKTRFRDHTNRIFKKHGIEPIGYWVPEDPEHSKNTLIYIVVHPSKEAADKNWKEFGDDPEWKKVAAESEASGKIVQKVDRVFMDPTEFSKLK